MMLRSLVTRRSYLIGVIVNNLANSYVADTVRGIEEIGKCTDMIFFAAAMARKLRKISAAARQKASRRFVPCRKYI